MRIPPYWAKEKYEGMDQRGRPCTFVASGWSFSSRDDAKREAAKRAKRIFELITFEEKFKSYEYLDRPIKEEILNEINDGNSQIGLVTRNRYGALILNSPNVLFADVDFQYPRPNGFLESILLIFSRKKRDEKRQRLVQETVQRVEHWARNNPSHSFRLYRTQEGLRLLFTNKLYDPTSEETASILNGLEADPMYMKLTQKQECFRARLTSKPWRCGCVRPPSSFPWDNAEAESAFRRWEDRYAKRDAAYKTCDIIKEFGYVADIAALKTIIDVHDLGTKIESNAPLA